MRISDWSSDVCSSDLNVEEVALPPIFDSAVDAQQTVMAADMALNLAREYRDGRDKLSAALCEMIEGGLKRKAVDYNRAAGMVPQIGRASVRERVCQSV